MLRHTSLIHDSVSAGPGTDRTTRRLYQARGAVAAVTALVLLLIVATYATGQVSRTISDLGESAVALLAAVNCALAARSASGRLRIAWAALAVATLSWGVGQLVWSWYELVLQTPTPFPGLPDIGFLGFPLGAVIALTVFPSNVSDAHRQRMTLDGLMVACALALVSWATTLGAVVQAGGDSLLALSVSVAYPLSDIALLVVCVLVISRSRTHRMPLILVASGLALMAVGDSGFAYLVATGSYATGSLVDLGWFFAFGMLAIASLAPSATAEDVKVESPSMAGILLPYIPLAAAAAVLGWQVATGRQVSAVEAALAVAIGLLVLIRQSVTVHENQHLARAVALREAQLRHQAFHDQLTGVANRALFIDRAAHALALHRRDRRPLSICFLDLDGFKAVNDQLGHKAGDDILQEVSTRLLAVLSEADTLSRFGGDEFAVLLENQSDPVGVGRALLESLREPFNLSGREVSVLASIGVARVDLLDPTPTVDELLVRADLAMYVVKRRGKAGVLLHTQGLKLDEVDDVVLGRALWVALLGNQVSVSFQPIVDLSTGRIDTLEALARWAPAGQTVSSVDLTRVAEACQLIDAIFQLVLAEACAQLVQWSSLPDGADLRIAVNVSPGQLESARLPALVAAELDRHGLAGARLVLEITETGGLVDTASTRAVCRELRALGVSLSVCDFGAGQSSLARLRDLPVNEIKIDSSFITDIDRDEARRRFVWGVVAFAERIDITVIAEGVERGAEREVLTRLGCHRAQGLLFSRPVSAEKVQELLRSAGTRLPGVPAPTSDVPMGKVRRRTRDQPAPPPDAEDRRAIDPPD